MSESQVRADRSAGRLRVAVGRARLVVPLLLVNSMAITGQVGYGLDHLAAPGTPWPLRVALALLFASALESIGLYVGWHSHTALVVGATASAARLRVSSYTIAAVVAGINYAHYAAPGGRPTAAAVAYGLVSLLSPWLWGLHSRRERHAVLERSGLVDAAGARFSAERWRAFPWRTRQARRWSIDHGVTDPRAAWEGYHAERDARRAATSGRRWRVRAERVSVPVGGATGTVTGGAIRTATAVAPLPAATPGATGGATETDTPAATVASTGGAAAPASGGARRRSRSRRPRVGGGENKVARMRAHWDRETAAGRVPTGAELASAAGAAPSLGRRKAAEWRTEPAAPTSDTASSNDATDSSDTDSAVTGSDGATGENAHTDENTGVASAWLALVPGADTDRPGDEERGEVEHDQADKVGGLADQIADEVAAVGGGR